MGIAVLPPDVNSCDRDFTPVDHGEQRGIRFGLGAIKTWARTRRNRSSKRARSGRTVPLVLRFLRARRPERGQPAHDRKPDQGRRHGLLGGNRAQLMRRDRQRDGNRPARLERPAERTSRPLRRCSIDETGRRGTSAAASCPIGRRSKSSPAKKKCSGSTSPAIRWTSTSIKSAELATHTTDIWKVWRREPKSRCAAS